MYTFEDSLFTVFSWRFHGIPWYSCKFFGIRIRILLEGVWDTSYWNVFYLAVAFSPCKVFQTSGVSSLCTDWNFLTHPTITVTAHCTSYILSHIIHLIIDYTHNHHGHWTLHIIHFLQIIHLIIHHTQPSRSLHTAHHTSYHTLYILSYIIHPTITVTAHCTSYILSYIIHLIIHYTPNHHGHCTLHIICLIIHITREPKTPSACQRC